jgi:hypothetical protein
MKRFTLRILSFGLVTILAINLFGYILFKCNYFYGLIENSQIYVSVFKSQKKHIDTGTFIFGDSVGNQMYYCEDYNGSINSLCTVMPLTLAGQYMLIRSICEYNDMNNKTVVLLLSPNSLASELDNSTSVHYFLKPFYNATYKPFVQNQYCSETAQHYLREIKHLSENYGFTLKLLPTIQNENKKESIANLKEYVNQVPIASLFTEYFSQIIYKDSSYFNEDGTHFKEQKLSKYNILDL